MGGAYRPLDNKFHIVITYVSDSTTDLIGIPYADTKRRVNAALLFCKSSGDGNCTGRVQENLTLFY